ncbi:MAG: cupin domain-containing protein [Acidobacteria bacterium]|nr:cupin domain-containing protein [Acidobacteriota bacterium]
MGTVVVVAVVWFGQEASSGQENPFTGTSFRIEAGDVRVSSRGFEAGARTHWHTHSEQLLFVKEGALRYQVEGQPVRNIGLHETARLPRGVRHWHGATPDKALTHVSITFPNADGEHLAIEWMEPVTDDVYESGAGRRSGPRPPFQAPSRNPGGRRAARSSSPVARPAGSPPHIS